VIGSLRGVLLDRSPTGEVLVEVGGVGYRATVAPTTLGAIGELGSQVFLHVHTHLRDDALILYGFATLDERRCFETLIGAHGVGPALALAILSVHSPTVLRRVLLSDDVDALTLVPGVGKKTAARLLVELKSRLDVPEVELVPVGALSSPADAARAEVRAALAGLGYAPDEIRSVVVDLGDGPVEDLLRTALKQLAVAR
jgi:Holliday junction DNA helicase RuvA